MASLGSIFVDLVARTGKYTQGLKEAADGTSKFERNVNKSLRDVGRGFDSIGASIKASIAALASGAGLAALTKNALDAASRIKDLSDTFNLTTGQFQAYEAGAKLASVSSEQFVTALSFLNKQLAEGKLPYKDIDTALTSLAEKTKNAKTGLDRTAIAVEAFGAKGGQKLVPFLSDGAQGLIEFKKRAEELGLILKDETIKRAEQFGDELDTLGQVIKNNFQQSFLEGFVDDSDTIRSIYTDPNFIQGIKDVGAAFGAVAGFVLDTVNAFKDAQKQLAAFFIEVGAVAGYIDRDEAFDKQIELNSQLSANRPPLPLPPTPPKASGGGRGGNDELEKRKKLLESINDSLNKQTTILQIQNDLFDQSETIIEAATRAKELEIQLADAGVVLTERERNIIQEKLNLLNEQSEIQAQLHAEKELQTKLEEESARRQKEEQDRIQDSVQRIREDLAGGLIDVIKGAKSIGDAFKDVAAKIAEAVIQAQLLKLITESTGGSGAGGGGAGGASGILGFLGGLFSFDVGTSYVPYDMIAQVHQGEMIIPRSEADSMRNGSWQGGGGGVTMNVYTPDANSFRASERQITRQIKNRVATA